MAISATIIEEEEEVSSSNIKNQQIKKNHNKKNPPDFVKPNPTRSPLMLVELKSLLELD